MKQNTKPTLTYGEQWFENKTNVMEIHGFEFSDPDKYCGERMGRKEAIAYYNDKLDDYWKTQLSEDITSRLKTPNQINQVLKILKAV